MQARRPPPHGQHMPTTQHDQTFWDMNSPEPEASGDCKAWIILRVVSDHDLLASADQVSTSPCVRSASPVVAAADYCTSSKVHNK